MNPIKTAKLFAFKMRKADYRHVVRRAKEAGEASGRATVSILADVLWCSICYGAAFTDYFMFEFYKKPANERKKFITMSSNNKLISCMNNANDRHVLDRKTDLVEAYREFMHREILVLSITPRSDVLTFLQKHPTFFAKKNFMFSAKGVERFSIGNDDKLEEVYDKLISKGFDLIEEPIIQHPGMARLYPGSVNTLRVVTALKDDQMEIVFAAMKTGNGGVVDNMNAGGLSAAVNVQTGEVYTDAIIKGGGRLEKHPLTGIPFKGFQVPKWEEVKELLERVVRVTPGLGFVGWDVAITEDGPILIEGNYIPGYDLLQLPDMTGRMWIIDKYVR